MAGIELLWSGRAECIRSVGEPARGALVPMCDESVDCDTTRNVIVEGDNLDALKLLSVEHDGAAKLVYIDPPYNSGRSVAYPDRFDHAEWLSMMYPRLVLGRRLLREDGLFCASIGNEELAHLRLLLDEIFGAEHFVALLVRRAMHTVRNSSKDFNHHADYVLVYAVTSRGTRPTRAVTCTSRATSEPAIRRTTETAAVPTSSTR